MLTVITPAATYDLTVLATVKERLGITDTASDTLLGHLISAASGRAAAYCNRVFAEETVEETLRLPRHFGQSGRHVRPLVLTLVRFPVSALVSATDGTAALTPADYELDGETGQLYRLDGSDNQIRWTGPKLVVRYTAGYALLDSLPYGIEEAVIELVKSAWFGRKRDPLVKSEAVTDIGSTDYWVGSAPGEGEIGLPETVAAMLNPFRRIAV
jgi:hypothetical protein